LNEQTEQTVKVYAHGYGSVPDMLQTDSLSEDITFECVSRLNGGQQLEDLKFMALREARQSERDHRQGSKLLGRARSAQPRNSVSPWKGVCSAGICPALHRPDSINRDQFNGFN
jgi:hypothetical protein